MNAPVLAANFLGWPVIQLAVSFLALRLPDRLFTHDSWLTAPRRWERDGTLYRDWLVIRRWKTWLPDGAAWLGGYSKNRLHSRSAAHLAKFLLETRRAECAHWCALSFAPVFFVWNPLWACWMMTGYALSANLPCILAQRYNRIVLARLLVGKPGLRSGV